MAKAKTKGIVVTNKGIDLLMGVLKGIPIQLDDKNYYGKSSARRRFVRLLKEYNEDYTLELEEMKKKYAEKEKDGKIKTINNLIQFSLPNRKIYKKELEKLNDLEIEISIAGSEKDRDIAVELVETELKEEEKRNKDKGVDADLFDYLETLREIIDTIKK